MKIPTARRELYGVFKHLPKMNKTQFALFKKFVLKTTLSNGDIVVTNKQTKLSIYINKLGLEHSLNLRGTISKTKSVTVLTEIIEKALLSGIKPDTKNNKKIVLYFTSLVNVDDIIWEVKIAVKEDSNGKFHYQHDLFKIKKV